MNERIREFATLAKEHADTYDDVGTPIWFYMYNEKLTELIVRDCINIACEHDKPKLSGSGLAIACKIESHFDIYIEEDGRFVK